MNVHRLERHQHPRPPHQELRQKTVFDSGSRSIGPVSNLYVDDDMARVLGSVSGFSAIERRRRILRGIGVVTLHELQRAPGGRRPPSDGPSS